MVDEQYKLIIPGFHTYLDKINEDIKKSILNQFSYFKWLNMWQCNYCRIDVINKKDI